ncbi:MAG: exodeoxyribonuclease III [Ilumatobacter sp.]|nr:exodeoxyribonuclease III [Ilumatobacter sp.]
MRAVTWNVNSLRSRIGHVTAWIDRHEPDVVLLQETKCSDEVFDESLRPRFVERGFETAHHGRDHRNGVLVASRVGLHDVRYGFDGSAAEPFDETRLVIATCGDVRFASVYVPNGRKAYTEHWHHKVAWLRRLRNEVAPALLGRPAMIAGDVNVQRDDHDVYDPRQWRKRNHATPEERAELAGLLGDGWRDVLREHQPGPGVYTWWNHAAGQFERNRGMRIDLALCSLPLAAAVTDAWVDVIERAEPKSSDHAPVVVDVDLGLLA